MGVSAADNAAGDEDRSSDGLVSGEAAATDVDQEDRDTDKEEDAVPEKLADDDERKEKWYRRAFFTVFPKLRRGRYQSYWEIFIDDVATLGMCLCIL